MQPQNLNSLDSDVDIPMLADAALKTIGKGAEEPRSAKLYPLPTNKDNKIITPVRLAKDALDRRSLCRAVAFGSSMCASLSANKSAIHRRGF